MVEYEFVPGLTLSSETSFLTARRITLGTPQTDASTSGRRSCRILRKGMRVTRVGAEIEAILCARYFPVPNQALIVGK
jgi:hypothetical protein